MLTDRDITLARVAMFRWLNQMGREIPNIWHAGFRWEAIDKAEVYNEVRDVLKKLGEMRHLPTSLMGKAVMKEAIK